MVKFMLRRLLHGIISAIIVTGIVMILVYAELDRMLIFAGDPSYTKKALNDKTTYTYETWEKYGYLDYVSYTDYLVDLENKGELDLDTKAEAVKLGKGLDENGKVDYTKDSYYVSSSDSETVAKYVREFSQHYIEKGYTIVRLKFIASATRASVAEKGGKQQLFAYKNIPIMKRMLTYFSKIFYVDSIYSAKGIDDADRKLEFTLHDPAYGGKFSPAIMGYGTNHRYLLYFDNKFPFIHQNLFTIRLGTSYTIYKGQDIWHTMTITQGSYVVRDVLYPSGIVEQTSDDLHSLAYVQGSYIEENQIIYRRYVDDYTNVDSLKDGISPLGYSFIIGIIATIISYLLGVPLGILLARKKDKLADKIGTVYIVFIVAVPSLAYIFMFAAIGRAMGLPTTFFTDQLNMEKYGKLVYILPILSLALPSVAGFMRWLRRYMIDQMNSDYVKFARSGGLSEREIFSKHILKNAIIPIVHGIPGAFASSLVGALVTERVYSVPGVGNTMIKAINNYDNGVIVGITLFYALLSVISILLGDILMSIVDPRISFTSSGR